MPVTGFWEHGALPGQWAIVLGATLVAAAIDLRSRRIPNWLTGPCLLGGLAASAGLGGWAGLGESLVAAVVVALPTLVAYAMGHGGAGDAKLMAAVGAWLGLVHGLIVTAAVAACGVLLACGLVVARRATRPPSSEQSAAPGGLPYGVAILAGTFLSALGVWIWHA